MRLSEQEILKFNRCMSIQTQLSELSTLVGTWCYEEEESYEPSGTAYQYYSEDGRFFHYVYDPEHPERRIPLILRYSVESSSKLRVRSRYCPEGWTVDYSFDGTTLTQTNTNPHRIFICSRVAPEKIPEWFQIALTKSMKLPHDW